MLRLVDAQPSPEYPHGTNKFFLCMCGGGHPRTVLRGHCVETSPSRPVSRFFSLNVKVIM